jgi:hypothetical protein
MAKQNLGSPAKYKLEDRMLFIGLPSMLLAGFAIWLQHLYGDNPTGLLAAICVLLASAPFLAIIAIFSLYFVEEKDKFQVRLRSGAMLGGIGATLSVTTVWGVMEQFHLVPEFPVMWVMGLFCMFFSVALAIQRWRYR